MTEELQEKQGQQGQQGQQELQLSEMWRQVLSGEVHQFIEKREWFMRFPGAPRCKLCCIPFSGLIGKLLCWWTGLKQSRMNPNICDGCENMAHSNPGGAVITLTILFADIRNSTTIAEKMSPLEYSRLINRFNRAAGAAIVKYDGLIDKFMGDAALALFIEGVAGADHASKGLVTAREILAKTGNDANGKPWVPVGIGVFTGVAWVGAIGSPDGGTNVSAAGDSVNIAARLGSLARAGEILTTQETLKAAREYPLKLEVRTLNIKGKAQPMEVVSLR